MLETPQSIVQLGLAIVLFAILAIVGIYDVIAIFFLPPGSTVTAVIYHWSTKLPLLPLAVGIICGHLFFPYSPPSKPV